jgi:Tfp pilus assembly protein PilF
MRATSRSAVLFALSLVAGSGGAWAAGGESADAQIAFGVEMARRGLWSEALFRFKQAERLEPASFRVYNNLAVAYEANGMFDLALDYYQRALKVAPSNRELRRNYSRFIEFYQSFKPREEGASGTAAAGPAAESPAAAPGEAGEPGGSGPPGDAGDPPPGDAPHGD